MDACVFWKTGLMICGADTTDLGGLPNSLRLDIVVNLNDPENCSCIFGIHPIPGDKKAPGFLAGLTRNGVVVFKSIRVRSG